MLDLPEPPPACAHSGPAASALILLEMAAETGGVQGGNPHPFRRSRCRTTAGGSGPTGGCPPVQSWSFVGWDWSQYWSPSALSCIRPQHPHRVPSRASRSPSFPPLTSRCKSRTRQAAAAIGATAARHAVLSAFPHSKLLGSVLAVYKNSLTKEDCLCWLFNAVPSWGLHSVGGPRLTTCYANSGVLTFFVVVVVARTGKLLDEVGGTTRADGSPLPRGPKVSCRAAISPAPYARLRSGNQPRPRPAWIGI